MVFSDLFFIFAFLPAFMLCYLLAYLLDKKFFKTGEHPANVRNAILVLFSLIFYASEASEDRGAGRPGTILPCPLYPPLGYSRRPPRMVFKRLLAWERLP